MNTEPEPHACPNCEGVEPASCLMNPNRAAATPADEIRAAAVKLRSEAADMPPAPDLTVEYPDLDAAAAHIAAGCEMQRKYALAQVLDDHARTWDPDPDVIQTWDARFDHALTLARLINQESAS